MKRNKLFCILLLCVLCVSFTAQAEALPEQVMLRNGGSFVFMRKADGTIWGWGDNRKGQLGLKPLALVKRPKRVAEGLDGNEIVDIQCGNENTLFLKNDGTVYTCGNNAHNTQGLGTKAYTVAVPTQIPGLADIVAVSCGFGHNAALDKFGHVWTWGRNDHGQLGIGQTRDGGTPTMVAVENIVAISCGGKFVLALDKDGVFWGWGSNEFGVLAPGKQLNYPEPIRVAGLESGTPVSFAGGSDCAFILDEEGVLWAWGRNDFRQLGDCETNEPRSEQKVMVDIGEKVVSFTAYSSHTIAIGASGDAYVWGSTSARQLGNGTASSWSYPTKVWSGQDTACAAVGSVFTSILTADGYYHSCGNNAYGQQGIGTTTTKGTWEANGINAFE